MNIDKNNISAPKQLIGGERRDKGVLQIFYQSTDPEPAGQGSKYSTGLNGMYNMKLLDLKTITTAGVGSGYVIQMISDTFKIDRGNINTQFKFIYKAGVPEIPNPIEFRQTQINNNIELSFLQLGVIGQNINAAPYNILLTFEYEKL